VSPCVGVLARTKYEKNWVKEKFDFHITTLSLHCAGATGAKHKISSPCIVVKPMLHSQQVRASEYV